jgi:transposase
VAICHGVDQQPGVSGLEQADAQGHHFASYTGTAPVEASSGDVRRHRLNRGGNRQLNTALHLIAVCQIRDVSPGQAFYQRKLAEAKTPEEARRGLKRHLANVVYRHLIADHYCRMRTC